MMSSARLSASASTKARTVTKAGAAETAGETRIVNLSAPCACHHRGTDTRRGAPPVESSTSSSSSLVARTEALHPLSATLKAAVVPPFDKRCLDGGISFHVTRRAIRAAMAALLMKRKSLPLHHRGGRSHKVFSLVITSILGSASILTPLSEPAVLVALGLILFGSGRALRARMGRNIDATNPLRARAPRGACVSERALLNRFGQSALPDNSSVRRSLPAASRTRSSRPGHPTRTQVQYRQEERGAATAEHDRVRAARQPVGCRAGCRAVEAQIDVARATRRVQPILARRCVSGTRARPGRISSAAQVLVEEIDRALPRELRGGFVVARRRVVVEAVLGALVGEGLVRLAVGLERRFVRRPSLIDARIVGGIVNAAAAP